MFRQIPTYVVRFSVYSRDCTNYKKNCWKLSRFILSTLHYWNCQSRITNTYLLTLYNRFLLVEKWFWYRHSSPLMVGLRVYTTSVQSGDVNGYTINKVEIYHYNLKCGLEHSGQRNSTYRRIQPPFTIVAFIINATVTIIQ